MVRNRHFRLKLVLICLFASVAAFLALDRPRNASSQTTSVLPAPNGISASDSDFIDKIQVSWNVVRGATSYRVFRSTTDDAATAVEVGTTAKSSFLDTTAAVGQVYFYRVKAENSLATSGFSLSDNGLRASGSFHSAFYSPLGPPSEPTGNAITAAKAALGKTLFWDEQLSSTNTVACGTCHRPANGGADPRTNFSPGPDGVFGGADDVNGSAGVPLTTPDGNFIPSTSYGFGVQVTTRRAPSYINAAYSFNGSFWDGRASSSFRDPLTNAILLNDSASLESQSVGPPLSNVEMAHAGRNWPMISNELALARPLALARNIPPSLARWIDGRSYPQLFNEAFGTPEINPARIAMAIATHERTLYSDRTPFDRWAQQLEELAPDESRGRDLFVTLNCNFCHGGPVFSNQQFHYIGVRPHADDLGRAVITGSNADNGRFKTPGLRNGELRNGFMHNGRLQTVEEVIEFYNRGGDFTAANKDARIRPLNLTTQQRADLVAFLKRPLTDARVRDEKAPFDRPRLASESNLMPTILGSGRAGINGAVPNAIAIEPPFAGNTSFSFAVSGAAPNAPAVLVIDQNDPGVGASIPATGSFARISTTLTESGTVTVLTSLPGDSSLVGRTFFARWYVTDAAAANGFSVSRLVRFTVFARNAARAARLSADFDGDSKTDISVFRPSTGVWWQSRSSDQVVAAAEFGNSNDVPMPFDFTGDGRADIAFWRPSTGEWFVLRSENGSFFSFPFGRTGDIPAPGDYDADGIADAAVFRPTDGTWFINGSAGQTLIKQFGTNGDMPAIGDYDADGRADIAIFRPSVGEWWIEQSADGRVVAFQFGLSTDRAVPGDFTGDGKTDAAFFRPSTGEWFVLRSEDSSFFSFPFGAAGDSPAPGDYDGDGRFDAAVFRPSNGTWFMLRSTAGVAIAQFGQNGDVPAPGATIR